MPSHTTVVAYLALFAAVTTGGAYALSVERNSVKSRHLADDAIKRAHVADNAIGAEQVGQLPYGQMTDGPEDYSHEDEFDFNPITYDKAVAAQPNDAFNIKKGTFTAPVDGLYEVSISVVWKVTNFPHVSGNDLRLITLNPDGSSKAVLLGPNNKVDSDNQTNFGQTLPLKQGQVIQLTITPGGPDAITDFAEMTVRFVSG